MSYTDKLKNILQKQRMQLDELESAISTVEADGLADENMQLKAQILTLNNECQTLAAEVEKLKTSLKDQMLNERHRLLSKTEEQLQFYYSDSTVQFGDKLTRLENKYKAMLTGLQNSSDGYIREAEANIMSITAEVKSRYAQEQQAIKLAQDAEVEERDNDPLPSPEAVAQRLRLFNLEMNFGTKVINVLGILLILLGVGFGLQYSFTHILLTPELRGAAAYALGILFLAGGEILLRQKKYYVKPVFSMGITAGGVAILFTSTAVSYFGLGILSMFAALGFCVGISIVAFLLSLRHSSKTIACFALIGGYLPMTAIFDAPDLIMPAMAYFILLNSLALFLAIYKKWNIMNILSFVLCTIAAVSFVGLGAPVIASVAYLSANFLMYLGVILIYPIRNKSAGVLTEVDVGILSANTIINCLLIYGVLNRDETFSYNGLLAIGFFIVYFAGAKLVERFLSQDKRVTGLFYITALIFAILVIPLQFGLDWLTIGWIVLGAALVVYGVIYNQKGFRWAGWLVSFISVFAFLASQYFWMDTWMIVNYTFLTFGFAGILASYYYAKRNNEVHIKIFKYSLLVQNLAYLLIVSSYFYNRFNFPNGWLPLFLIMLALIYGLGIKYIPVINDRIVDGISLCISIWAVFAALISNGFTRVNLDYLVLTSVLLIVFNVFSVFVLFDAIKTLQKMLQKRSPLEGFSLVTSVYSLILVIMMLMVQYNHSITSILISSIGMAAALAWIIFGFIRHNRTMRLFGLVFSVFSLAKLFFVDLYFLPAEMRIVSYFVFGIIFLAISFVYQYFSRRLEG